MVLSNWPCGTYCAWNGSLSVFKTGNSATVTVENLCLRVSSLIFVSSAQAEGLCKPQEMTTRASCALCAERRKHERSSRLGRQFLCAQHRACTLGIFPRLDKENHTFSCPEDLLMVLSFFFSAVIHAAECAACLAWYTMRADPRDVQHGGASCCGLWDVRTRQRTREADLTKRRPILEPRAYGCIDGSKR